MLYFSFHRTRFLATIPTHTHSYKAPFVIAPLIRFRVVSAGRAQEARLPEGVPDHRGHVHDHVRRPNTTGFHVHVDAGRQGAVGQQDGAHGVPDEQHQEDILVRVLRAAGTGPGRRSPRSPSPLEADPAAGAPDHRRPVVLVVHGVLNKTKQISKKKKNQISR